jgi:HSP20 family protein
MLMRFDPFREVDRLAEQALASLRTRTSWMPLDAYRKGDEVVVELDLPGVDPASIELTVEKNVLTVSAERKEHREDDAEVLVAERWFGRFTRQLFLGEGLDLDNVHASYDHGVLRIRVPVAEAAKPRRVEIHAGDGRAAIEAEATETTSSAV